MVYAYSVLQHLPKNEAKAGIAAAGRVLKPGGLAKIEMPNAGGLRCLYHQARRRFREARDFEVRYWTPAELLRTFTELVGPAQLEVDGYFTINPQRTDLDSLPWKFRALVRTSDLLRSLSRKLPMLGLVADSLFVCTTKAQHARTSHRYRRISRFLFFERKSVAASTGDKVELLDSGYHAPHRRQK